MGIPGILKEIGRGERIALSKLAVEHLERTRRPLKVAIDAAIWNFQNQAGQGGVNPALRTLFYRLLKLLALPIHPVFVYDGKNKPLTKRGKTVSAYGTCIPNEMSKKLVQLFRYPHHTAPGEAEAECAFLQRQGIVDAVMSQDVDAIMFGSTMTLRNWSKEGTRGNKSATHVDVLRELDIKAGSGLTPQGLILIALLSGGDYDTDGVSGFGPTLTCEIAKAGFGADLLDLVRTNDEVGLQEWRERLQYELESNESGYFKRKHKTLRVPEDFPNRTILGYYINPAVTLEKDLPTLKKKWEDTWNQEIDIPVLRQYTADRFEWLYKTGAKKFTRCLAPSLLAHRLHCKVGSTTITSSEAIKERRMHFINDGVPELRVEIIPDDVVGLDMDAEEGNPGWLADDALNEDEEGLVEADRGASADAKDDSTDQNQTASSQAPKRKSPPWDPSAPEKLWIPETIVQLGVPALVEEWKQKQRDILADPVKFSTGKCGKIKASSKSKVTGMKAGALDGYFAISKPAQTSAAVGDSKPNIRPPLESCTNAPQKTIPTTPTKQVAKTLSEEDKLPGLGKLFGLSPAKETDNKEDGRSKDARKFLPSSSPTHQRPLQSQSQHKKLASGSTDERIIISPSPPPPSSMAAAHNQESIAAPKNRRTGAELSPSPASRLPTVSNTVTQRRTQRRGRKVAKPLVQTVSPRPAAAAHPPIESFFKPQASSKKKPHPAPKVTSVVSPAALVIPPELSTGLKSSFLTKKKIAVSRDSLPGTWKEIDPVMNDAASPRTRGRPRVSCLDMTGD